jgi:hypothetical protein
MMRRLTTQSGVYVPPPVQTEPYPLNENPVVIDSMNAE